MNRIQYAYVQEDGSLTLPAEVAARLGLTPGSKAVLVQGNHQLTLGLPATTLRKLYVEPTNLCNLNCSTCMRTVWDEPLGRMSAATFERVLDGLKAFSPLPTVFFGGIGEPLFHPAIVDMIRQVKALGGRVELISNGILLDEEMATQLIQAGLDFLWVSVDGATPQSYLDVRLGDALPQVLENLRRLRALRDQIYSYTPQLGIAFVAMKRNVADLPEIIRTGINLGVKKFSVTNVLAHTPELNAEILYQQALYRGAYSASDIIPKISLPRIDLNEHTQASLLEMLRGNYQLVLGENEAPQVTDVCPFITRGSAAVRWDGALSPCLPLLHTHASYLDERVRRSHAYTVDTLHTRSLKAIWLDEEYLNLRQTLQAFAFSPCVVCNSCEFANENVEDCFGNLLPTCGACLWAQGLIQCP